LSTLTLDVTDRAEVDAVSAAVFAEKNPVDIWINNAGISDTRSFAETPVRDFDRVMSVNMDALIYGTRVALQRMLERGSGLIINMASVAGHVPAPYMCSYVASKHAVVGFTRALTEELRLEDSSVDLMLVSPGFVATPMIKRGADMGFPEWLSWMLADADSVAKSIVKGIESGRQEINPTLNGKLMRQMHWLAPNATVKASKVLLAKSFKDMLMNRFTRS